VKNNLLSRILKATRSAIRPALKTAWWMAKLTIVVSLIISILQYIGVITFISQWLNPIFHYIGLPGEASLAFISGYFVNLYSAVAAAVTLQLDARSITILAVMCLCAHNMIVETSIQKKTGSSVWRMLIVRTVAAIASAFILNVLLPNTEKISSSYSSQTLQLPLNDFALQWLISNAKLLLKMFLLIVSLNILQKLLAEFGIIRWLSKILSPVLRLFGLPVKTSFLWLVANILGLAYGSAIMLEEVENGKVSCAEADLLNHHIGIAHSNLEDVSLFFAIGASVWWMLLSRWALAAVIVWIRRGEVAIFNKRYNHCKLNS
jgi:hypothetical protein